MYEVAIGNELRYTDPTGRYLVEGHILDLQTRTDLTQARIDDLNKIKFDDLPLELALKTVKGNGKRVMAIFEDPNCGYCKRFERDLQKIDNVTVHVFLYPILGPDSIDKSRNIWCAKDKGKAWLDWMVKDQPAAAAQCDTAALARNLEFGKKHKITGTPTLVFVDGTRVPGAIGATQVEKLLAEAK
jgi:thiol:disulfide interchange protein DsbC